MNSNKLRTFLLVFVGGIIGMSIMYIFNNYKIEKKTTQESYSQNSQSENSFNQSETVYEVNGKIDELTAEDLVIKYVKEHHQLPDYYLTKSEARNQGWVASEGNLCDVLPGKAIGGDKFSNREGQLPKGEKYFEADINYNCGNRGADRIVFTKDGEVWLTHNHYKSFEKQ